MPPKRRSTRSSTSESSSSKKKPRTEASVEELLKLLPSVTEVIRCMRWSKVSGSKNADESYRLRIQDDAEAYSFICVCKRVFGTDYDDGEDESNEDEEGKDGRKGKQEKRENVPKACKTTG